MTTKHQHTSSIYYDSRAQWLAYILVFGVLLMLPLFIESPFTLNQFSRYAVYGLLALSVSLVWGYGGILSLGQGIAFGMGAYGMGATMQMQYQDPEYEPIPSFMLTNELQDLPMIWEPFNSTTIGLLLSIGVPTIFFLVFGAIMFRARLAGAFVAIMTLAMLGAWYSMAYDMQPYTNGFNGISPPNALDLYGFTIDPYSSTCYLIVFGTLAALTMLVKLALSSKFGTIIHAIRDDAERVRFLGYSVSLYQTVIFTASGFIAALAGMLWVVVVQYVSPTSMEIVFSIQMVIWAAIGGRLSLIGAIIGAIFINGVQSYAGDAFQSTWFLILGGIFVLVIVILPSGFAGLFERMLRGVGPLRRTAPDHALTKKTA